MAAQFPSQSFEDQIQQWAAADPTGETGDLILSPEDIRDYVQENLADIGNLTFDKVDLPLTAEARQQTFFDEVNLMHHWVSSGLITWDSNDNIVKNDMLYILVEVDEATGGIRYIVYVDYDDGS